MHQRLLFPLAAVALLVGIAGAQADPPGPPSAIPPLYAEPPPEHVITIDEGAR